MNLVRLKLNNSGLQENIEKIIFYSELFSIYSLSNNYDIHKRSE